MNATSPSLLRRIWTKIRWPIIVFASLYCLYVIVMYFCQRSFIFPGQYISQFRNCSKPVPAGCESLWIETDGVECEVWYLPPSAEMAANVKKMPDRAPLVIYTHGNGEYIDDWGTTMQEYRQWGCAVALVEYPGYGRSKGAPSESAIREVLCKTYDKLTARPEIDPERVILHGRSLGGGAICTLAEARPAAAALILESTFTSVASMAGGMGLPGFLVRDPFDNLSVVRNWKKPLLIMHGNQDNVVPFSYGKALYVAAPEATFVEWNRGHNESPQNITLAWDDVRKFLDQQKLLPELKKPAPKPAPKPKPPPKTKSKPKPAPKTEKKSDSEQ